MTSRMKRTTQADVARLAGVSQAMVSYVLNNKVKMSVSPETRERIMAAADELGYVPNGIARSLRIRKTMTIACVVPDMTNPFHTVFARGVQDVAEQHDYDLLLYNTDRLADKERKSLRWARQGRVDGVIMTPLHLAPADVLPLLKADLPVVVQGPLLMPSEVGGYPLDSLHVNHRAAATAAVRYLVDKGHRRIAMIAGESHAGWQHDRVLGYRQALADGGIEVDERLIGSGYFREEGGYARMKEWLALADPPTAVFAASDVMAVGALVAIREMGLSAPGDVAVMGFDDIPLSRLISPALTTVAQFPDELGERAAQMLFDRLAGTAPPDGRREEMRCELVIRESA